MRIPIALLALVVAAAMFSAGCSGPERKLGRGLDNLTEFVRGGEIHRSIEQTHLWDGRSTSVGFLRGFNRSVARTGIGLYEVVTFPFPSYDPLLVAKHPLYPDASIRTANNHPYGGLTLSPRPAFPDSYAPGPGASSIFATDTSLGFSGGDVMPIVPGSRFRIFEF